MATPALRGDPEGKFSGRTITVHGVGVAITLLFDYMRDTVAYGLRLLTLAVFLSDLVDLVVLTSERSK